MGQIGVGSDGDLIAGLDFDRDADVGEIVAVAARSGYTE